MFCQNETIPQPLNFCKEISDFRITHIGITASILKMMHLRRTYHSRRIGDALRQFAQFATTTTPEDKKPTLPPPTNLLVKHGPGVVAAAAVMTAGFYGAEHLGQLLLSFQGIEGAKSPVSGIPISILLGMSLRNMPGLQLPDNLATGLKFSTTTILRAGIICVGAKLSALEMISLGAAGVPVVALSIATGLGFVTWLGPKLGLPRRMTSLIAAGTSICGVTAITACAPAIKANQQEVSFAVANVVAFGTIGMLCYPYIAHATLDSSQAIGTFLGLAIHDTSQVMGAALTYNEVFHDEIVLKTAAVTKLTRNLFLAGVIPALVVLNKKWEKEDAAKLLEESGGGSSHQEESIAMTKEEQEVKDQRQLLKMKEEEEKENNKSLGDKVNEYVPLFVLGFVGMSAVRSVGDAMLAEQILAYGYFNEEDWKNVTKLVGNQIGGHYLLGTAMAAVGMSTSASALKGVGVKPFIVGLSAATCVAGTAFTSVTVLSHFGVM